MLGMVVFCTLYRIRVRFIRSVILDYFKTVIDVINLSILLNQYFLIQVFPNFFYLSCIIIFNYQESRLHFHFEDTNHIFDENTYKHSFFYVK